MVRCRLTVALAFCVCSPDTRSKQGFALGPRSRREGVDGRVVAPVVDGATNSERPSRYWQIDLSRPLNQEVDQQRTNSRDAERQNGYSTFQ